MNVKLVSTAMLSITLLCGVQKTTAQKTEPVFEVKAGDIASSPSFLVQAATGELIAGSALQLTAIDPTKKSVIWENKDFLALSEADITIIEGTPFLKIERQNITSLTKNRNTYIIQANDGKIVYDSKGEGIKVRSTLIIPQLGGLLLEVVKDGFLSVSFVDFANSKTAWTVPLAKERSGGVGIGALKRAISSYSNSAFNVPPIIDAGANLLLVYKKEIFAISKIGTVAWKKEYEENVDDAYISTDKKALFIGYKKYIDKLNTSDGNSLLKEPIKMRDELNGLTPMGNDYIVYNQAGINIMDADGNMKWKKDTKLGNIAEVKYTSEGIMAVQPEKDEETTFYWLDYNGKKIWDQVAKGGYMLAEPTPRGILYVTTERANTLNYEKGKDVWNKDIKLKGVPNFGLDVSNKILYAYANEKLHAFNFNDISYHLVAEDIALKKFNAEEEKLKFDFRKNGSMIVISSSQNVLSLQTADGKINYNNYFKDIGNTKKKWMKALGAAASVASAAMQVNSMSKGDVNINATKDADGNTVANSFTITADNPAADAVGGAGADLYAAAKKRYLATKATKDNLYILSEMPEGNGLLVWNKEKGEATKKIYFSDTTPIYVVDEATDRVYVMVGSTLKAYNLN